MIYSKLIALLVTQFVLETGLVILILMNKAALPPTCRLTWNGKMDNWDFAIYKFSDYRYASDEWFFPGQEYVDGMGQAQ